MCAWFFIQTIWIQASELKEKPECIKVSILYAQLITPTTPTVRPAHYLPGNQRIVTGYYYFLISFPLSFLHLFSNSCLCRATPACGKFIPSHLEVERACFINSLISAYLIGLFDTNSVAEMSSVEGREI